MLSLVQILPLAIRRVRPTLSFALVATAMAVQVFVTDLPVWGQVAMPVPVYSVAAYAPRVQARAAFVVAWSAVPSGRSTGWCRCRLAKLPPRCSSAPSSPPSSW